MKKAPPVPRRRTQYLLKISRSGILAVFVDLKLERRKSLESCMRRRNMKTNSGRMIETALTAMYVVVRLLLDAISVIR